MGGHFVGYESVGSLFFATGHRRRGASFRTCKLARLPRPGGHPLFTPPSTGQRTGICRGESLMWGYSEDQIASFGLTFGVGAFMLYMLFIIGHLAWESKAGKFGTFVLF